MTSYTQSESADLIKLTFIKHHDVQTLEMKLDG
nr:MAG TPA: hypothetical protein [Caudoviricetes sp.]